MNPAAVLNIIVTAQTGQATSALNVVDKQLKRTAATAQSTSAKTAAAVGTIGKRAAIGIAAIGGGAIVAAAQFEDAFADVRKTVDATEPQFKRIEEGILEMSKHIPVAADDLAHLAGEAGALGVASKDIVKFTKTAAELGTATDLSASDAANALARLGNIMEQDTAKAYQRMGSTLVDLGNKGASTEKEISDMALRIAGAGKTVGLQTKEVLGLAAALANVGIRAEMGGSAISRVMLQMQDSIAQGGETLEQFAEISGMSVAKFRKSFEQDAPGAIETFARGLDKIVKGGGSVMSTLEGVELNDIRVRDTLLRLAGATGEVTEAQRIANSAWKENTALAEEARKKYKTTASQFDLLKNRVMALAITFGQDLLPKVNEAMKALGKGDIGGAIKVFAELGGQLGAAVAKGIADAFLKADLLGKVAIGALLIRGLGGKGALVAAGAGIGKFLGIGIASGAVSGSAGGAAAGGAASAAAAGGIGTRIMTGLKAIKWARVGMIGVGLAAGQEFMTAMSNKAAAESGSLTEAIQGAVHGGGSSLFGIPLGESGLDKLFPSGIEQRAEEIVQLVGDIGEGSKAISPRNARDLKQEIKGIGVTSGPALRELKKLTDVGIGRWITREAARGSDARRKDLIDWVRYKESIGKISHGLADTYIDAIKRTIRASGNGMNQIGVHLAGLGIKVDKSKQGMRGWLDVWDRALGGAKNKASGLNVLGARFKQLDGDVDNSKRGMKGWLDVWDRSLGKAGDKAKRTQTEIGQSTGKIKNKSSSDFKDTARNADRSSGKQANDLIDNNRKWVNAVLGGHSNYAREANKQFKSLGVKAAVYQTKITGRSESGRTMSGPGNQRGGLAKYASGGLFGLPPAMTVPGSGSGDSVHLEAAVEPGEKVFVLNRNASKQLDTLQHINQRIGRFQRGGTLQHLQTGGLNAPIAGLANLVTDSFGGSFSGTRPGDDGFHGSGDAIDWTGGDWEGASRWANQIGPQLTEGIYWPIDHGGQQVSWDTGHEVPTSFWGGDWPPHRTHIHFAALNAIAGGARGMAGGGGGWEALKRLLFMQDGKAGTTNYAEQGRNGRARRMLGGLLGLAQGGFVGREGGQAGLDKAWAAINAFGEKKAGATTITGGGSPSANAQLGHRMLTMTPGRFKDDAQTMTWGPWGESEWSPYNRLIISESNWSTTAENPSSGAYGIPQSLPASKMATAGSKWRTDAATQIAWGLNYIKDVYGAPSNTPLGGYARGGLVALQNGGLVRAQGGVTLARNGKGDNKPPPISSIIEDITATGAGGGGAPGFGWIPGGLPFALDLALRGLAITGGSDPFAVMAPVNAKVAALANERSEWGLPAAMDSRITGLVTQGEISADYASMASTLGTKVGGKTEAGWLNKQLIDLLSLRNAYIDALPYLQRQMTQADSWLAIANKLLADYEKTVRVTEATIARLEHKIATIEETVIPKIDKAIEDEEKRYDEQVKKENKRWDKRQQASSYKKKGKKAQDEEKKDHDRRLKQYKDVRDHRIKRLKTFRQGQQTRLNEASGYLTLFEGRLEGQQAVVDTLPDVTSALESQSDLLSSGHSSILSDLTSLQGPGRSMSKLTAVPKIGVLGGTFFDIQNQLRELSTAATGETDSEVADLLRQQLEATQRQVAIAQLQAPVFSQFAGFFARGGTLGAGQWGIAGEAGAEAVVGPAQIVPGGDGATSVHLHFAPGTEWLRDFVRVESETVARRGRSRSRRMIGAGR